MTKIHLWPQENQIKGQNIQTSVTVETSNNSFSLWYRLPLKYQDNLTDNCDPFVIATIFLAMSQGSDLIVHGQVSPSLLDNLEEFQAAWSSWKPKTYQKIIIKAQEEKEIESSIKNKRAITAFSGGVDSSFTAFSHTRGNHSRKNLNLQAGLMVHGFDIPIRQKEVFDRALQKAEIMLSSLGLVTIPLSTNFRQVIKLNWEDVFATGVASCLHMVKKGFSIGLIPSSYPYRDVNFLWGSNPFTDLLLSSNSCRIIHDGAEFTRLNKIEQMLEWQEFLDNLRVCWQGDQKDCNCGRCEKCVRNILNFRVLNHGLPPCFEKDVTNQEIWNLKVKGGSLDALETLMKEIELNEKIIKTEPWLMILKLAIIKNKLSFYQEIYRLLKPEGIFVLADALEGSPVAKFLNIFVDQYNSMGHQGVFLNQGTIDDLKSLSWEILYQGVIAYHWYFSSVADMLDYCKLLFGLDKVNDQQLEQGLQDYLGFFYDNKYYCLNWELFYIKAKKINCVIY